MTIDYEVTADDVLAYQVFVYLTMLGIQKKIPRTRLVYGIISLMSFILAMRLNQYKEIRSILVLLAALTFMGFLYLLLYVPLLLKPTINRQIKKDYFKNAIGRHQMTINPETYIVKSQFSETKQLWQGIDSMYITNDYIYIYLTQIMAYIIPKRSFPDQQTWDEFIRNLQTYYLNKAIIINE